MSIDFYMNKLDRPNYKGIHVTFPDNVRRYLTANHADSSGVAILTKLDEYDDTLLNNPEMQELLNLCDELIETLNNPRNYRVYEKIKASRIKKSELQKFAAEFSVLLKSALENDEAIWATGD